MQRRTSGTSSGIPRGCKGRDHLGGDIFWSDVEASVCESRNGKRKGQGESRQCDLRNTFTAEACKTGTLPQHRPRASRDRP